MNAFPSTSLSDNRKSAIQNPKWVGIFAIAFTFTIGGAVVQAQQPKKVSRIGLLMSADSATEFNRTETFRAALRELGYIEGQNINIEYRYADGKLDSLSLRSSWYVSKSTSSWQEEGTRASAPL